MADIKKLEKELWEAADNLRANSKLTSQQYCMPVLGLIFLRYAWGRFKMVDEQIQTEHAQQSGRQIPIEPADYTKRGAMFIPEEARYDYLLNLPENEANIGEIVNKAMESLEKQNPQLSGVLPKTYTDLGNDLLRETLRIFNNPALDERGDDIIGRIYEYFLGKFAPAVASDDGVFFTPKSLVRMIMNVIEPVRGVMLDPACGSGGMFVSASDYVREQGGNPIDSMTFYGQEKVEYNAKLCLMNMAVHGMNGRIKSGDEANTFYNDAHSLYKIAEGRAVNEGEGLCDYVAANPPFNVDKVKAEDAQAAGRMPLGISGINKAGEFSNANYLWINYFYSYLNEHGRAGFVMASSATDSSGKDRGLRETLVKTGHVDAMLYVGNNFFYTKSLPCTLWFFDKGKPEALKDKVLFVDAQNYHTAIDTTHNEWSDWQLKNLSSIVWLYRGETDKYAALLDEYRAEAKKLSKLFEEGAGEGEGDEGEHKFNNGEDNGESADDSDDEGAGNDTGSEDACIVAEHMRNLEGVEGFAPCHTAMLEFIEGQKASAKALVEGLPKRQQKKARDEQAKVTAKLEAAAKVLEEAIWLVEKFGTGEYADVPGLCKIATCADIKEKNWSLTPGAHVGVPPVQDDGVDFHERMGEIHEELLRLQADSNDLMTKISENFKELGL